MAEPVDVPDWMREIHDAYAETLPGRIDEIRKHLDAAADGPGSLDALESALHRLHGSAGSYGFDEIGAIAGACEELLNLKRRSSSVTSATIETLRREVDRIAEAVKRIKTGEAPRG